MLKTVQFPTMSADGNVLRKSPKLRHWAANVWVNQARNGTSANGWIPQNTRNRLSDTTHMANLRDGRQCSVFDIGEPVKPSVRDLRTIDFLGHGSLPWQLR
jgi:hypothetical protein